MTFYDFIPFGLRVVDSCKNTAGSVRIQWFDDPTVLFLGNLIPAAETVVHQIRIGDMIQDKLLFFFGEQA